MKELLSALRPNRLISEKDASNGFCPLNCISQADYAEYKIPSVQNFLGPYLTIRAGKGRKL